MTACSCFLIAFGWIATFSSHDSDAGARVAAASTEFEAESATAANGDAFPAVSITTVADTDVADANDATAVADADVTDAAAFAVDSDQGNDAIDGHKLTTTLCSYGLLERQLLRGRSTPMLTHTLTHTHTPSNTTK